MLKRVLLMLYNMHMSYSTCFKRRTLKERGKHKVSMKSKEWVTAKKERKRRQGK